MLNFSPYYIESRKLFNNHHFNLKVQKNRCSFLDCKGLNFLPNFQILIAKFFSLLLKPQALKPAPQFNQAPFSNAPAPFGLGVQR